MQKTSALISARPSSQRFTDHFNPHHQHFVIPAKVFRLFQSSSSKLETFCFSLLDLFIHLIFRYSRKGFEIICSLFVTAQFVQPPNILSSYPCFRDCQFFCHSAICSTIFCVSLILKYFHFSPQASMSVENYRPGFDISLPLFHRYRQSPYHIEFCEETKDPNML